MMAKKTTLSERDMTPDQLECFGLLCDLLGGAHHVPPVRECGYGIRINMLGSLSTWDFARLTRLVVLCHDRCIRGEVSQGGPGSVCVSLHKRHGREGRTCERHPTLEDAIATHRKL